MPSAPTADYSRKWFVMAAVTMGVLLATIDGSIVNVASPTLVDELGSTFPVVQWVTLSYLLAMATLTLGTGRLGDIHGKKRIYTLGYVAFTVASVLCGLAPGVEMLIGFRVLQAIGAAMILSLGAGILVEAFPPSERGRALGMIGTMVSVGIVAGPAIGGILIENLSWRWIFFVNLPVGIIGTITAIRFVPDTRPSGRQSFDFAGAAAMFVALLTLLLALTIGQDAGFTSPAILALFGVAAVSTAVFVAIELRVESPMLQLRLFREPMLSMSIATGFITFVAISGLFFLMPFYLENVLGFDPQTTGFLLASSPVALGVVSPVSGWLSDRIGVRPMTLAGLTVLMLAYLGVQRLGLSTSAWQYVLVMLPIGVGMGLFQSPNNSAIMGSVPREHSGVAGAMLSLTRILGQTTGIAVIGSLWAAQVASLAGSQFAGEATAAPASAQVSAIHTTFAWVTVLMGLAVVAAGWALWQERRSRRGVEVAGSQIG